MKKLFSLTGGLFIIISLILTFVYEKVESVPSFARKYSLSCTECHSAFPKLSAYGRQFKINGYVRERDKREKVLVTEVAEEGQKPLILEQSFPWGGLVKLRPYDQKKDKNAMLRVFHELELFVAGSITEKFSYFTEIEAEDEGKFEPELGEFQTGYHPSPYVNILLANRSFFMMDPFQTLSNVGKLTRSSRDFANQGQTSGVKLDSGMQTIAVYGEITKKEVSSFYYSGGISTDVDDPEGKGPIDLSTRLAFDTYKGFIVGAFLTSGKQGWVTTPEVGDTNFEYSRAGIDVLVEMGNINAQGAFVQFSDKDLVKKTDEANKAFYVEGFYTIKKNELPILVPLIRYDMYEKTNGTKQYSSITAQLGHYPMPNVRAFLEYWAQTDVPATVTKKDNRITLQIEVGF